MHQFLTDIVKDPRLRAGALPWAVVLFVLANLAVASWRRQLEADRKQNLLLGTALASGAGTPRYDVSVGEDTSRHWRSIPDASKAPLVIVSGMSQMYAINDAKPGDQTIVEHLDDELSTRGVRAFGLAAPNLDNEEALLYLVALSSSASTRPRTFVYGVCFDKFRNVDIRPGLRKLLSNPEVAEGWRGVCEKRMGSFPIACEKMRASLAAPAADASGATLTKEETLKDRAERRLRDSAGASLPLVGARAELNAALQTQAFLFRNWVFRIKPTSKRPVIQSRYELNKQLLELMVSVSKQHGMKLVLYVIPLNPQAENPYVPEQYAEFKRWVEKLARDQGVPFANLEGVVPLADWGEFMGGPDFKHFRGPGHRATARAILDAFGPDLFAKDPAVP